MSDLQAIADRVEIEALPGEFTDAIMMRDWGRFASLFAPDGAWRMPHIDRSSSAGRRSAQGAVRLDGDTAIGRTYNTELGHMRDGSSQLNYSLYHDSYGRTPEAGGSLSGSMRSGTWTPRR